MICISFDVLEQHSQAVTGGSSHLITQWDTTHTPLPVLSFSNFMCVWVLPFHPPLTPLKNVKLFIQMITLLAWTFPDWQLLTCHSTCLGPIPLFVCFYKDMQNFLEVCPCTHTQSKAEKNPTEIVSEIKPSQIALGSLLRKRLLSRTSVPDI